MQNEIPIIQKVYDFYRELYLVIEKMPKKDKYTLGGKLSKTCLDLMELLIFAGYSNREDKITFLNKASIKLELLKILIRLGEEIKAISTKKYLLLEEKLQEIGRMLGGWMRSLR